MEKLVFVEKWFFENLSFVVWHKEKYVASQSQITKGSLIQAFIQTQLLYFYQHFPQIPGKNFTTKDLLIQDKKVKSL